MSAIFYHNDLQRELAEKTRDENQKHLARPIVTLIQKAGPFYDAEEYVILLNEMELGWTSLAWYLHTPVSYI